MADTSTLVKNVLDVAKKVAPLLGPGGATALAAATALEQLLRSIRGIAKTPKDKEALDKELLELQKRVGKRAEDFADSLGSGT